MIDRTAQPESDRSNFSTAAFSTPDDGVAPIGIEQRAEPKGFDQKADRNRQEDRQFGILAKGPK